MSDEAPMSESARGARGVDARLFKDAMATWASTVTVVAVRGGHDGRIRATTVTSFAPVSAEPPEVVVSLNPSAQVLPFLDVGDAFGISLLARGQRRWARVFADSFPVGPMPWPEEGVPVLPEALAALTCSVRAVHATEGRSRLIVARVEDLVTHPDAEPLLYWKRAYHGVADEEVRRGGV